LLQRVERVFADFPDLDTIRTEKPGWWYKDVRTTIAEETNLIVYRFYSVPDTPFVVTDVIAAMVFRRHCGMTSVQHWDTLGSLIIPDIFQYLNTEQMNACIDTHPTNQSSSCSTMGPRVKTEWQLTSLLNLSDVYKELSIDKANFAGSDEVPSFLLPLLMQIVQAIS
jgi:hypothetical protein